jgi:Uncharacterized protein conserved in bacteria (DUF2219)
VVSYGARPGEHVASLLRETGSRMRENAEIDFGIVGPGALGKQVQNDFHQFIGVPEAKGWTQLQQEFGAVLSYERLWRLPLIGDNWFGVDIVPQLGAPIGNIYTYGETGVLLRIGRAGCRLRTRQNTPRVVWNGLFRRGGSRRRAGLLFFCRHTRAPLVATSSSAATRFGRARASRRSISSATRRRDSRSCGRNRCGST